MPDGRGGSQAHVWVATWASSPLQDGSGRRRLRVTAWESVTGRRFSLVPLDPDARARYLTLFCVFTHNAFHANAQDSDHVASCNFDLDDAAAWEPLDPRKLAHYAKHSAPSAAADFALAPTRLDVHATELAIEAELRGRVENRAAKGCENPNFKGSYLGRFPLVSADLWTSDRLSERSRSVDAFSEL